jgi:hypothetical protein
VTTWAMSEAGLYAARPCLLGCRNADGEPFLARHGYRTCDPCADRLRTALVEIVECYALLDDAVLPSTVRVGGRGVPGFGPRSPGRDAVIVLRDSRTVAVDDGDPHSVLAVLSSWADNVRDDTGLSPRTEPAMVSGEAAVLIRNLDWITRRDWVGDLGDEVHDLARHLRDVLGVAERSVPIGPCPTMVHDLDHGVPVPCGAALRARLSAERITCRSCGSQWPRERWDELRDELGTPVSDVASLSVWLHTPAGTLRRWKHEDGWHNHGTRSRPLYARAEVVASWRRRRAHRNAVRPGA